MTDEERPPLPYDEWRTAIGDDPFARSELDALHAHLGEPSPDPQRVGRHIDTLRGVAGVEAQIANWWDDPRTQRWIKALTDAGL